MYNMLCTAMDRFLERPDGAIALRFNINNPTNSKCYRKFLSMITPRTPRRWKSSKRVLIFLAVTGLARVLIFAVPVVGVWFGVTQTEEVRNEN